MDIDGADTAHDAYVGHVLRLPPEWIRAVAGIDIDALIREIQDVRRRQALTDQSARKAPTRRRHDPGE